ncbi:MAG: hypothetical protein L3J07_04535 [Candidatus Magasanikbacteria bacterium]|nr:hypothetical protein [Candidatus Magasanikbacteria bacterium]
MIFFRNFFIFLLFLTPFIFVNDVLAIDHPTIRDTGFSAKYVDQSIGDPIVIPAGTSETVTIRFKNTGTKVWYAGGSNFISAYTIEPKYHDSLFRGSNWIGSDQTATISKDTYQGQIGELKIDLIAPNKVGEYTEKFYLAAENYSWVRGSYFFLKIKVINAPEIQKAKITQIEKVETKEEVSTTIYKAQRFILNKPEITAVGGEQIKIILGYQNVGESAWQNYSFVAGGTSVASGEFASFADASWQDKNTILQKNNPISSGGILRETFFMRAPAKQGNYTARFQLKVDGTVLGDGIVEIPITVTSDAPSHYVEPVLSGEPIEIYRLSQEPRIRVGLWRDANFVEFVSDEDNYNVFEGTVLIGILPRGTLAKMSYSAGIYTFSGGGISLNTKNYIRLEPISNERAVFTLRNYERQVSWKGPRNFNKYRGAAEYRVTQDGANVYLINDVLFEDYTAGIGETTNYDNVEYIKALLTSARTYAYYIQQYSSKHDKRNFDVVAHTGDQLYLGYLHETLAPKVAAAATATKGSIITYNGTPVITPYFGNTDGRTRAWSEVWGGEKPWLVSVKADYDLRDGKSLFGHGVGMSQRDAEIRADELGSSWVDLVKYYYTGVEVEKFYK